MDRGVGYRSPVAHGISWLASRTRAGWSPREMPRVRVHKGYGWPRLTEARVRRPEPSTGSAVSQGRSGRFSLRPVAHRPSLDRPLSGPSRCRQRLETA